MAIKTKTIVEETLTDDLDGSTGPDVTTHVIALDDKAWEIELSGVNWKDVLELLAPIREKGRPVKGARKAGKPTAKRPSRNSSDAAAQREENKRIKEWGAANGFEVKESGRPSRRLQDAYQAAMQLGGGSASGVGVPEFVAPPELVAA